MVRYQVKTLQDDEEEEVGLSRFPHYLTSSEKNNCINSGVDSDSYHVAKFPTTAITRTYLIYP
jgi:hypothetical protein